MLWLLRRPTGFIPLGISLTLLLFIFEDFMRFGRQSDEGTAAHLFQIFMPLQAIVIALFAISWLPRNRIPALQVLTLQCGAALTVLAVVYFLGL